MGVLFVDYDKGAIGDSVRDAYVSLAQDSFPTLKMGDPAKLTIQALKEEVCQGRYFAALYISASATARLETALSGVTTMTYNRTDVMTFIWNEARYSTIVDVNIAAKLRTLSDTARTLYLSSGAITLLNTRSSSAVSVFASPWTLSDTNLKPTVQGARIVYNTLVIILILIQEFFYLGSINALYSQFKIYTVLYPHRIIIYRFCISAAYTLIGSLCTTSVIYAFRADWSMGSAQIVLTWEILWLFAHLNFQILDVLTVWIPGAFMPLALITWMMFNVTSILVPFELSPGVYRWAYVMPAHEVYEVLTDIWSGGCNPKLYYALPILVAMEVVAFGLGMVGVYRRCHYAVLAEEGMELAFKEKIEAAVRFERRKRVERAEAEKTLVATETAAEVAANIEGEEEQLANVIREGETRIERQLSRATTVNFGPSFGVS